MRSGGMDRRGSSDRRRGGGEKKRCFVWVYYLCVFVCVCVCLLCVRRVIHEMVKGRSRLVKRISVTLSRCSDLFFVPCKAFTAARDMSSKKPTTLPDAHAPRPAPCDPGYNDVWGGSRGAERASAAMGAKSLCGADAPELGAQGSRQTKARARLEHAVGPGERDEDLERGGGGGAGSRG